MNPDGVFRCGLKREDGLFLLGLALAAVQAALSTAWAAVRPPETVREEEEVCGRAGTACVEMANFKVRASSSLHVLSFTNMHN